MKVYETRDEAVLREVVEPIEATGVVKDAYEHCDVDAIADAVVVFCAGRDGNCGVCQRRRSGYVVDGAVDFWAVVEQHER